MDTKKRPLSVKSDDNISAAEGQLDVPDAAYRRMPESLRNFSGDEISALNSKIVRKVDFLVLPTIGILYILNYIDRQNLAAAKLQGIMEDLNMTTQQFATAVSILFVGYLPFQIPSNLIITKISRPGMYICVAVVIWGGISAATAAVKTYGQLLAVRAILGAAEAVFFPGAIYYLSAWYTKKELGKRIAGLYIAQQVGNAFGGLFAAAILQLDGTHNIAGWQWLFIIEGSATVGIGAVCSLIMPEFPHNSRILSQIERDLAVWRIESEAGAAEGTENESVLRGFKKALSDPKLLLLIFANMLSQTQGSIANYFPTLVASLNFNNTVSLLLTAPPYILAGAVYYVLMYYSDRKNTVYPIIQLCVSIAIVMYIIPMATLNVGARYFSMVILPFASVGPQLLLYKTINLHLARPVSKRAAASALVNAIGGTSNIWASYLYYEPPQFYAAFGTLMASAVLLAVTMTVYRWLVLRENKRLDSGEPEEIAKVVRGGVTEEMVQLNWRYEMY
ncbi:major facilitator superfamily domain-containing protein [Aspergillus pseudotamarii]|uniref:Major facilitator superfamily domain-containing protein n=1 Tax=Aspergillus pseudotamarii TaxID=132259 RepID=A0A5N6TA93_ASPPS|nr:major facilitator superfamily domain-containing protein [Aspergillus pseudotamarii]KAE8143099.1 major facilitator superfamily domain-containing protein [Aspergillus pseudotamarii]